MGALTVLGLTLGYGYWGRGDNALVDSQSAVVTLGADNLNPIPGDETIQRSKTGLFITRARIWAYHWGYACRDAPPSAGPVKLYLSSVKLGPKQRAIAQLWSRLVYAAPHVSPRVPGSQFGHQSGPGAFRFIVSIPRACVWALAAPPVQASAWPIGGP